MTHRKGAWPETTVGRYRRDEGRPSWGTVCVLGPWPRQACRVTGVLVKQLSPASVAATLALDLRGWVWVSRELAWFAERRDA